MEHVLIADDDTASLLLLKSLLKKEGYRVTAVADGRAAVAAFASERPDLVLLDVTMPVMDGYEAARRIKQAAGDHLVPIIFLTALSDEAALARCIEVGGDDFITKPYSGTILRAKMGALGRLRGLYRTVSSQRDALAELQAREQEEQELARGLFTGMLQRWPRDLAGVRYLLRPSSLFNGDLILIARGPSGRIDAMLGDFTGHGLSAAVGGLPAAELFYSMSASGYAARDIVSALNRRLHELLPAHVFCAAALISLDPARGSLGVFNAGLPDLLLRRLDGSLRHFPSRHLPLGVVGGGEFRVQLEVTEMAAGERLYLYSDGLVEEGGLSPERLEALVACDADECYEQVVAAVERATAVGQRDDIALLEVTCPGRFTRSLEPAAAMVADAESGHWRMALELGAAALRQSDPLPVLLAGISEVRGLSRHRASVFAILSELFNNALEHGLLGLDSATKESAEGFALYYEQREEGLKALREGFIRIDCRHEPSAGGGRLFIRIEDSGPGFDFPRAQVRRADETAHAGRGLGLVASLCESLTFSEPGNRADAVFAWSDA